MWRFSPSTKIAGAGRVHPDRTASVESTRVAGLQLMPSGECETTRSAVLSGRTAHQTPNHPEALSPETRVVAVHWPVKTGSDIGGGVRGTNRPAASNPISV